MLTCRSFAASQGIVFILFVRFGIFFLFSCRNVCGELLCLFRVVAGFFIVPSRDFCS